MIGLIEGELKYVRIDYEMTLLKGQTPAIVREVYEEHIGFLASSFLPTAPPSLATIFPFSASRAFTWMVTQKRLVDGIFTGFAICFPVAFCVLFLATGSVRVSLFAVLTIALIVGSLLGSCELSGWPLGTGEAIAGTIVIGLAVDYTVHLGHIYTDSKQQGRRRDNLRLRLLHVPVPAHLLLQDGHPHRRHHRLLPPLLAPLLHAPLRPCRALRKAAEHGPASAYVGAKPAPDQGRRQGGRPSPESGELDRVLSLWRRAAGMCRGCQRCDDIASRILRAYRTKLSSVASCELQRLSCVQRLGWGVSIVSRNA